MADLKIAKVSKSFALSNKETVHAVKALTLEIRQGELFVLLGPSGCGKTTTLRLIAGLDFADSGEIFIGGKNVSSLPAGKRNISIVFQNPALLPQLTVRENVCLPLKLRKISGREKEAHSLLSLLGLAAVQDRFPETLSGGQLQRAALARALVLRPEILLLDEPLSNLDPISRRELRCIIRQVQQQFQTTTIYVTHDQAEAFYLGDRIGLLNNGSLQQCGNVADLTEHPESLFVAKFLGHGLNILPNATNEVINAIRPEDICLTENGELDGTILQISNLGGNFELLIKSKNDELRAISHENQFHVGQTVRFTLPQINILRFDSATGKRIS